MEELLKRREELLAELKKIDTEIAKIKNGDHLEELEDEILEKI